MSSTTGGSFFPRIESVFYTVFDVRQGPKIVHQVPEGLIATGTTTASTSSNTLYSASPASSTASLTDNQRLEPHQLLSPQKRSVSSSHPLFNLDDISKYVMPHSTLCGRLVICATSKHRIIGFPVELRGPYERNAFRYNLCFVFERHADLSCYEPIVRKVSRVLTACEEESRFLSSSQNSPMIHAILEQLYEDLNSYSETSIPIDKFNSIELKIFPFYPNPPVVKDWMVPLALINLTKRIEPNWDLTMVKICPFVDGVNHVSRIARLAECDIDLTRQAISHLLYYQVIMMIDIFQYSNMYTLRRSIQWLANETHVRDECGPYATKPGKTIADWPKLLHLYSRLKPGKTVHEWMEEHNVPSYGIDVRRFTSFGVIKGFLHRVHRWPILLLEADALRNQCHFSSSSIGKKRGKNLTAITSTQAPRDITRLNSDPLRDRDRPQDTGPAVPPGPGAGIVALQPTNVLSQPTHRASAAETLEQLRTRGGKPVDEVSSAAASTHAHVRTRTGSRTYGVVTDFSPPTLLSSMSAPGAKASLEAPGTDTADGQTSATGKSTTLGIFRPRVGRSPSAPVVTQVHVSAGPSFPPELIPLLDGEHHTDELCTRFEVGWPVLKQWLVLAGNGKRDDDFGQVSIIYR
ncbi:hypothetical protein AcV5_006340 [Taiwanofungus camphoratus]|nr:hypothetical protein AcV5_006340 [Antrodia cinnamomea]KAI0950184.1 hypothetical protein AcV7_008730 [Antrodia cinnamomea]